MNSYQIIKRVWKSDWIKFIILIQDFIGIKKRNLYFFLG